MVGSSEGAARSAATRVGLTLTEYRDRTTAGLRWCFRDQEWEPLDYFGKDRSQSDGLARSLPRIEERRRLCSLPATGTSGCWTPFRCCP